jgi:hypothetical protein
MPKAAMTEPEVQPDKPRKLPIRTLVAAGIAAGVAAGVVFAFAYYLITMRPWEDNSASDGLADRVQQSMQHELDTDKDLMQYHLAVEKVTVIPEFGNDYEGLATIRTQKGTERPVLIHVTSSDKDSMIWRTDPGAFLFVAQEELSKNSTGGS